MHIETKTVHQVSVFTFDSFVEETYGFNPDTIASEECGNDTTLSFSVDGDFDENEFNRLLAGEFVNYNTQTVLDKLCKDGHIPSGDYLIEVSW